MLAAGLGLAAGCDEQVAPKSPDTQFGHRYTDRDPQGNVVVGFEPRSPDQTYTEGEAGVDSIQVRVGEATEGGAFPVDVVVFGMLPDGCTVPDRVEQNRDGTVIDATLVVRRPEGMMCTQALRPFRLYFELNQVLEPGSYTLNLNGNSRSFEVE